MNSIQQNPPSGTDPRPRMVRHFHRPMRGLVIALTVLILLLGVAFWRFYENGMPLDFLATGLEQALDSRLTGHKTTIDTVRLAWDRETATLLLDLRNTRIASITSEPVAHIPNLLLGIDPWEVLRRRVRLNHAILVGGFVDIERKADGSFDFDVAPGKSNESPLHFSQSSGKSGHEAQIDSPSFPFSNLLSLVTDRVNQADSIFSELQELEIRDAKLSFRDQASDFSLSMDDLTLKMHRFRDSLNWNIEARMENDEHSWRLTLSGQQELATRRSEITLHVEDFVPARLAPLAALSPTSLPLRFLDLPLQGSAALRLGDDGALLNASIQMVMGEGNVLLPDPVTQDKLSNEITIPVNSGRIEARFDSANSEVVLDEVQLLSEQNQISLSGSIGFESTGLPGRRSYRVKLNGKDMVVHLDGITESSLSLEKLALQADVHLDGEDLSDAELAIEELELVLPTHTVNIYGSMRAAPGSPEFRLSITAAELSKEELIDLWPIPLEAYTRAWVKEYVLAARLENIFIRLNMAGGVMAAVMEEGKPFPEDSLVIETDLHGLAIDYLPPLPPLLNGKGGLRISDNRLAVWADTALVEPAPDLPGIDVENARFSIDEIYRTVPVSNTRLSFRGEASALLALLQSEAVDLRQGGANIEPLQSEGNIIGDLSLTLPLYDVIAHEHIDLAINASGSGLTLPVSEGNYRLSEAELAFTGSLHGISAKGHTKVNGVPVRMELQNSFSPGRDDIVTIDLEGEFNQEELAILGVSPPFFFEGRIPADLKLRGDRGSVDEGRLHMDLTPMYLPEGFLNWKKAEGQPASLEMQLNFPDEGGLEISDLLLRGEEIEAHGQLFFDEQNRLLKANFPVIRIGADTSLSAKARKEASGELVLDIGGASLDMRDTINNLLGGEGLVGDEEEDISGEIITYGKIDRLLAHEDIALVDGEFFLHQSGDHVAELVLDARLNETDFQLRLEPDSEGSNVRKLSVASGDGGAVLKGLNLYPHVVGGELNIEADVSPIGSPLQMRGKISGGQFHVINAPAFAQLLSLASLSGIAELLSQNGIMFQELELPFEMDTQQIRLRDGNLSGLSLGLSLRGNIERATKQVELHGVLIPSYGLLPSSMVNSILGNIPLLGELIVSRPGEGILGVTFLISGQVDDVSIVANPLSILTPGILRRLTEFGSSQSRVESEEGVPEPP